MAATYLDEIIASHRANAQRDERVWQDRVGNVRYNGPSMLQALKAPTGFTKVIAEIKRRSPSKGDLFVGLDPVEVAKTYASNGVTAISVLTDEKFFGGSRTDLELVASTVTLPILRKDFTISENDVLDAAEMGASTVLLIVAALSDSELRSFIDVAQACGIDALVEVHDFEEAQRAVDLGAEIIGVNQRSLQTFEVDTDLAEKVASSLPAEVVRVCESGLKSATDVARASQAGFHAVLVGETFVTSHSISTTVKEFSSVESNL